MKRETIVKITKGLTEKNAVIFHLKSGTQITTAGPFKDDGDQSTVAVTHGRVTTFFDIEDVAAVAISYPKERS